MLPWISWQRFIFGTATPGNGGPLLQPRGQTSVFYTVPPPLQGQPRQRPAGAGEQAQPEAAAEGSQQPAGEQQSAAPPGGERNGG